MVITIATLMEWMLMVLQAMVGGMRGIVMGGIVTIVNAKPVVMKQLMDDHVVPKGTVEVEQVDAEVEMAIRGAGGPLVLHWADA